MRRMGTAMIIIMERIRMKIAVKMNEPTLIFRREIFITYGQLIF